MLMTYLTEQAHTCPRQCGVLWIEIYRNVADLLELIQPRQHLCRLVAQDDVVVAETKPPAIVVAFITLRHH